jgi:hypothetical protein
MKPKKKNKIKETQSLIKTEYRHRPTTPEKMDHFHTHQKETRKNYKTIQVHKNKKAFVP